MPEPTNPAALSNEQLVDRYVELSRLMEADRTSGGGFHDTTAWMPLNKERSAVQTEVQARSEDQGRGAATTLLRDISGRNPQTDALFSDALKEVLNRRPGESFVRAAMHGEPTVPGLHLNAALITGLGPLVAALSEDDRQVLAQRCVAASEARPLMDPRNPTEANHERQHALAAAAKLGAQEIRPLLAKDFAAFGADSNIYELFLDSISTTEKEGAVRVLSRLLDSYSATDHLFFVLRELHIEAVGHDDSVDVLAGASASSQGLQRFMDNPQALEAYVISMGTKQHRSGDILRLVTTSQYGPLVDAVVNGAAIRPEASEMLSTLIKDAEPLLRNQPVIDKDGSGYLAAALAEARATEPEVATAVATRMVQPAMDIDSVSYALHTLRTPSAMRALDRFATRTDVGQAATYARQLISRHADAGVAQELG